VRSCRPRLLIHRNLLGNLGSDLSSEALEWRQPLLFRIDLHPLEIGGFQGLHSSFQTHTYYVDWCGQVVLENDGLLLLDVRRKLVERQLFRGYTDGFPTASPSAALA